MLNRIAILASLSVLLGAAAPARAQDTIKIGEINSYKAQPAFLEPYKKGWELAVEEILAAWCVERGCGGSRETTTTTLAPWSASPRSSSRAKAWR